MVLSVAVEGAGKRYRKYEDSPLLINAALRWRKHTRRSAVWALRGVDLAIEQGECVGVIGGNGSGKSTLLQLMAGVTSPTEGRVSVAGRVAPLLGVGVGFNTELTGRENIYLNGTILGFTRAELDRSLDDIVAFADIGAFIDTPVKFYSSGMAVRLGFAVAAQVRPDVLLLDEILAVGDIAFQMRCFDRMSEIVASGATVVLVSHNVSAVRRLCNRTLVLHRGSPRFLGATEDAIYDYLDALAHDPPSENAPNGLVPALANVATVADVDVTSNGGMLHARAVVEFHQHWEHAALVTVVQTRAGVPVYYWSSPDIGPLDPGRRAYTITCGTPLVTGDYEVVIGVRSLEPLARLDRARPVPVAVRGRRGVSGVVDLAARFSPSWT